MKVELQSWITGNVVFNTDIEVVPTMSVMSLRQYATEILFDNNSIIAFQMVVKTGRVLMYDAIAWGSKNTLGTYKLKKGDVFQVRNWV